MPRIAWVSDYTTKDRLGGCQETNQLMIEKGESIGFAIDTITPRDVDEKGSQIEKYDMVILNNLMKFDIPFLNRIINNCKYIRYEHDYDSLLRMKDIPRLFENSVANIFLSPMHKNQFLRRITLEYKKIHIQPSPVRGFRNLSRERQKNLVVYTGLISYGKGVVNLIEFMKRNPQLTLEIYSWNAMGNDNLLNVPNITFMEPRKNEELLEVYNKANYFIHKPEWYEPFGRSVMEAYFCGCNLILNGRIGCRSFNWDWTDYEGMARRNDEHEENFWDYISKFL